MSKSLKAALLSALVFPGSGHFMLKKHAMGTLLAGVSVVCIYIFLSTALEIAQELSLKIQTGEIPLDVAMMTQAIATQIAAADTGYVDISTYVLAACWLLGIADSYRVGRLQDKSEHSRETRA
jgi:hypothetical protein